MTNHLAGQVSPYLAAHAADPVDWHPWGEDAFAQARESDRPIFLSVGYQSCHWCHVMQRESFRNDEIAEVLNRDFVPIKLDRELRPDVDALYMSYVQATTGAGGWPMSVFLTPGLLPYFGGTYFPPVSPSPRMPSFMDVLSVTSSAWTDRREHTETVARDALEFVRNQNSPKGPAPWSPSFLMDARNGILAMQDERNGGFGRAPKFPMTGAVAFLLAQHERGADEDALHASIHAVLSMLRGGIWDHAGGGLYRYATDDEWLVPHFEKMLYDQAGLLGNLAGLVDVTQAEEFRRAACDVAAFLDRDLGRDGGGYWSSLDAETQGVEGDTYVWRHDELAELLSPEELQLAQEALGVTEAGNWEGNVNILTRRHGMEGDVGGIDAVLARLLDARQKRPQPAVITNALVGWNAMTSRGLIDAGRALESDSLVAQGVRTLDWLLEEAVAGDEVLHAIGDPTVDAIRLLEDQAALVSACLSAIEVAGRSDLVDLAERVHHQSLTRFAADGNQGIPGGYVMTLATELPFSPFEQSDAPTPSGAATLAENEERLARMHDREPASAVADAVERQLADTARAAPHMAGHALAGATRRVKG